VIVCWVHNWPECPEWIEVVELSKEIAKIADHEIGRSGDREKQNLPRRRGDTEKNF
jgi:hypothetical protein